MALMSEMNPKDNRGPLSDESKGLTYGELIRDYEPLPDVKWRFGKPNYARVNKLYFQYRSHKPPETSLEGIVNKLVKNWEVESHHIADIHQWQTMDVTKFKAALNGGCPCSAQIMSDIGPYNMLIGETKDYSAGALTFEESNKIFGSTFADGYAWECLEVLSGPPVVTFKWRHFGKYSGTYTDRNGRKHVGNGDLLNLYGLCIAKVSASLKIESLDVYYNPEDLIKPLVTMTKRLGDSTSAFRDEADHRTQGQGCCATSNPRSGPAAEGGCSVM